MNRNQKIINAYNLRIQAEILELECLLDLLSQSTISAFKLYSYEICREDSTSIQFSIMGINKTFNHNAITYQILDDIGYCFENTAEYKAFLFESKIKPDDFQNLCDLIFVQIRYDTVKELFEKHNYSDYDDEDGVITKMSIHNLIDQKKQSLIS